MDFKIRDIPGAIAGCFEKITRGRVRNSKQTACGGIESAGSKGASLVQHNEKARDVKGITNSANSKEGSRVSKCLTTITTIISKIPILCKLIHKKATNSHNVVNENSNASTDVGAVNSNSKETKSASSIFIGGHRMSREDGPVPEQMSGEAGAIPNDTTIPSEPSVDTKPGVQEAIQEQEISSDKTIMSSSVDVSKLKKGSREELGEKYSREYSGESIVTKHGEFEFECIPQYQLSGFSDEKGGKYTYTDNNGTTQDYKLYSSNFDSKDHVSNLWGQKISGPNGKMSFIRSGSSRGNEQPTKELLLNAAIMQNGGKEGFEDLVRKREPIILNLSNIQLMTPGKLGDGDIPWKQMQRLLEFSKEENGPITIPYTTGDGQTVDVKIELKEPLLFNFGVNFQHFKLGPLASSKEIDDQNAESFRKLFGANPSELSSSALCTEKSILGDFLANPYKTEEEKGRAIALATQIINILKKHPRGIESNPYALPVRVMLLTSLIGYATTYGCKSGKDRTGVCSLELEALATKLLSGKELYDPENSADEERGILKQLYSQGEANKIAEANTGQKGLKIQEFLGFTSLSKRFGFKLADDFVDRSESQELFQSESKKVFKEIDKDIDDQREFYNNQDGLNDLKSKISNLMNQKSITLEDVNDIENQINDLTKDENGVDDGIEFLKKFVTELEVIKTLNPEFEKIRHEIANLMEKDSVTFDEVQKIESNIVGLTLKGVIPFELSTALGELKKRLESVGLQNGSSDTDKGEVGGLGNSHPESAVEQSGRFEVNLADDFEVQLESKKVFKEIDETIDYQLASYDEKFQDGLKDLKSKISNLMKQKTITLDDVNDIENQISDLAKDDNDVIFAGEFITKLEVIKALINNPKFRKIRHEITNLIGKDSITSEEVDEIQREFISLISEGLINSMEINEISIALGELKKRL